MIEDYSFGSWIRRRRRALDLTQQELANRVNCSLSTIVKIESNERRPSRQIAELLMQHLDIPENYREIFLKAARSVINIDSIAAIPDQWESLLKPIFSGSIHKLPVPPTPIIGRELEVNEILELLFLPDCRLITITGMGGIGKTRLAIQVAHEIIAAKDPNFPHGIYFVPLAAVSQVENIPKAIARAIDFDLSGPTCPEEQLLKYLHTKRLLLVLDNAEHLLEGAKFFSRLIENAPMVKLLITSREILNLRGEWLYELKGLAVPPNDVLAEMENFSSVKFFLERVRQADSQFVLDDKDKLSVVKICRLLDGLPLGLELAAGWVRTLSLEDIASEISSDLNFLTTSLRDIPERHRSLRAVFDHSWNHLASDEKRTICQMSVFRGGFSKEAALEIIDSSLTTINSLIDKSLLRYGEAERYSLHDVVRGFTYEQLKKISEEETKTRRKHSWYYLSFLKKLSSDLHSRQQQKAVYILSLEIENIRIAWKWGISNFQIEMLGNAAQPFWYFCELMNYYREAKSLFEQAANMTRLRLQEENHQLTEVEVMNFRHALGQFLMFQGYFTMRMGRINEAEELFELSIFYLKSINYSESLAHAYSFYGVLNWTIGKQEKAKQLLGESVKLSEKYGSAWQNALFTGLSGNIAYELGNYDKSFRLLKKALRIAQKIGDPRLIGFISAYLGQPAMKLDRIVEIEEILRKGALLTRESGDRFGNGLILAQLALAAQARKDYQLSEQLLLKSIDLFHDIGDAWYLSKTLTALGNLNLSMGDLTLAYSNFRRALTLSLDAHVTPNILDALIGIARLLKKEGSIRSAISIAIFVSEQSASSSSVRRIAQDLFQELKGEFSEEEIKIITESALSNKLKSFARNFL